MLNCAAACSKVNVPPLLILPALFRDWRMPKFRLPAEEILPALALSSVDATAFERAVTGNLAAVGYCTSCGQVGGARAYIDNAASAVVDVAGCDV
ncbi:hypothetical protein [Massilia eburnea]|uniref:hypothetical protein n=1 Tax=Massilia eburnea TaxID=1776165 RepID=UPI003D6C322E